MAIAPRTGQWPLRQWPLKQWPLRQWPLRSLLTWPFLSEIVLVVGLMGGVAFYHGERTVYRLAQRLEHQVSRNLETRILSYFEVPRALNAINAHLLAQNRLLPESAERLLTPAEVDRITQLFWRDKSLHGELTASALYLGRPTGEFVGLGLQSGGTWQIGRVGPDTGGKFHSYGVDDQGLATDLLAVGKAYDPRQRPWYEMAVRSQAQAQPQWLDLYVDFKEQRLKTTLAQALYDPQTGELQGVVGADLVLDHITRFLQDLTVSPSGRLFVLETSGLIVATSETNAPLLQESRQGVERIAAINTSDELIRQAALALVPTFGPLARIQANWSVVRLDGEPVFLQVHPLHNDLGLNWLIVVAIPERDFMGPIRDNTRKTLLLCALAMLLAIGISTLTARWVAQPIAQLNQSSQAIARGQWQATLPPETTHSTEVNQLNRAFATMAHQLQASYTGLEQEVAQRTATLTQTLKTLQQTQQQLIEAEKMAGLGSLVAGVAHEINTPVGNSLMAASIFTAETESLLLELTPHRPVDAALKQLLVDYFDMALESSCLTLDNLHRAHRLLQTFEQVAPYAASLESPRSLPLLSTLRQVAKSLEPRLQDRGHRLEIDGDNAIEICSHGGAIAQVLSNLILNSLQHAYPAGQSGQITVSVESLPEALQIRYADDGQGIAPEHLGRIFEPFFTTARSQGGSGLGLSIVYNLVTQTLQGTLRCDSTVGEGTTFWITLPIRLVH